VRKKFRFCCAFGSGLKVKFGQLPYEGGHRRLVLRPVPQALIDRHGRRNNSWRRSKESGASALAGLRGPR
jgi:hypothetical protein